MARFLRAIRFDASDSHVFSRVAGENEWAIPGGFVFTADPSCSPEDLTGKPRQAFVSGFLALGSFGFTTLVSVAEATDAHIASCTELLADYLLEAYGAPSPQAARAAAGEEIAFAQGLAEGAALNTLLAVKREIDDTGAVRESFHVVTPPGDKPHTRIWDVVEEN